MNDRDIAALRDFDVLPDSANVRLPVVAGLFSIGRATVWRWTKAGLLPKPQRVGGVTYWNVGDLRRSASLFPDRRKLPPVSNQPVDRDSE